MNSLPIDKLAYAPVWHKGSCIRGFLHTAASKQLVITIHGLFGCKTDHHFMMKQIAEHLCECFDVNVYRFDFLGSGDSDGSFGACESLTSQIDQLHSICQHFVDEGFDIHLLGYSQGGLVATLLLDSLTKQSPAASYVGEGHLKTLAADEICSLMLISPAGNLDEVVAGFIKLSGISESGYDFMGFDLRQGFVDEVGCMVDRFKHLPPCLSDIPVALIQGTQDQYVSLESFEQFKLHFPRASTYLIADADHCYTSLKLTRELIATVGAWYGQIF